MSEPRLILLHPANVSTEAFAKLVGPLPFDCVYPRAGNGSRWDHTGESADVAALMGIEAQFICGYSSGGFMALRMLHERPYRGAMVVAAGWLKAYRTLPVPKVPLMLVHGTMDQQVPYGGTKYVSGADSTAWTFVRALGLEDVDSDDGKLPNPSADGCHAYLQNWADKMKLYTIVNGGHTYPTGPRTVYQPPSLGRVCRDFDASVALSDFFRSLP